MANIELGEHVDQRTILGGPAEMALCGRLLYFDEEGLPLWSNGGYLTKEDDQHSGLNASHCGLNFLLYIDGGDFVSEHGPVGKRSRNQFQKFHEKMGVTCLFPNSGGMQKVPQKQVQNGLTTVEYFLNISKKVP